MITGFFFKSMYQSGKIERQIWKLLKLFIISNVIYGLFYYLLIICYVDIGRKILLFDFKSGKDWFDVLILNAGITSSHLWYLSAILYILLLCVVYKKIKHPIFLRI